MLVLLADMDATKHNIQVLGDWLLNVWIEFDVDNHKMLNLDQVTLLMKHLNINLSKAEIKGAFKNSNLGKQDLITFNQFERLYKTLRFRPEIASLFNSLHTENPSTISFNSFYSFLTNIQKVSWDKERCQEIYKKFSNVRNEMDMDHFSAFLLSSRNSIIKKQHTTVFEDMTQPLANYFINSSHNTYLIGDQVTGNSSVEGYIRALQRGNLIFTLGCRCVELDCWDGPNKSPVIYHGRTLTSKLKFKDAIVAISKYAFLTTSMPLVLSLEIRCSPEQQSRIAEILINVLGPALITKPLDSDTDFPSPKQLMNRILVKVF
jgi:hypothetical protein